jgi:hypothetical protein
MAGEEASRPARSVDPVVVLFCLIVVSAFGPYVVGGLRTDQLFIYAVAVGSALLAPVRWLRAPAPAPVLGMALNWAIYAAVALIASIQASSLVMQWDRGSFLSGADNVLLPLAVMAICVMYIRPGNQRAVLLWTCRTLSLLAAVNGLLALVMIRVDLQWLLIRWWSGAGVQGLASTTAARAETLGRVSGIVNQPAEAGLLFGLAAFAAVYAWREHQFALFAILTPIVLGGLVTVSKIFVLCAMPLLIWQLWRSRAARTTGVALAVLAGLMAMESGLFVHWTGVRFLEGLLRPTGGTSLVSVYSAGRIGAHSTLSALGGFVLQRSPIVGLGAAGIRSPYDNGWIEALVMAGVVGVVCYTIALVLLLRLPTRLAGRERIFMWVVAILAAVGSIGLPTLTANRAGAMVWLIAGILGCAAAATAPGPVGGGAAAGEGDDRSSTTAAPPHSAPAV